VRGTEDLSGWLDQQPGVSSEIWSELPPKREGALHAPVGRYLPLDHRPTVVVSTTTATTPWLCRPGAARRPVPTAVYVHGESSWEPVRQAGLLDQVRTWFVPSAVFDWSTFTDWAKARQVVQVQPGFMPDAYRPRGRPPKRAGVLAINPCFGKGARTLLSMARAMPDVAFTLVLASIQPAYRGLGDLPNVKIVQPQEDLRPYYARAQVYVSPTHSETFGRTVAEAQAAGTPCVVSDLATLRATAGDGALYCVPDVVGPWVEACRAILDDEQTWQERSEAALTNAARYEAQEDFHVLLSTLRSLAPAVAAPVPRTRPQAPPPPPAACRELPRSGDPFPQGAVLHLGAGGKRVKGYVNTDVRKAQAPDGVVVDVQRTPLPARRFGAIYACHLLEHLYPEETVPILRRWLQALQPGGTVRLSVPDLRLVVANCVESQSFGPNPDAPLFGDFRKAAHDWDRHKRSFTVEILTRLLGEAGYVNVRPWVPSQYPEIAAVRDWSSYATISLNLEADRPEERALTPTLPGGPTPVEAAAPGEHVELSVIIGTYNRLEMLQTFVASVRNGVVLAGAAEPICSYEFVVADGGSTDGTLPWLAEQHDVRVVHGGLTGAIDAFNAAYEASWGELVMHANDDTRVEGDGVAVAVEYLRAHPEVGQVVFEWTRDGGKTWRHDGTQLGDVPPHPNQAVTRRLAIEDTIAHELGAFWGDEERRTHKTYGGDTYQWVVLARRGWQAVGLPGRCRIHDYMHEADDELREANLVGTGPGSDHALNFRKMSGVGRPGCWDLEIPGSGWPHVYVAEPGRPARRSPIAAGPEERPLVLHMGWGPEPLDGLRRAFARMGPYRDVPWVPLLNNGGPPAIEEGVLRAAAELQPTLVWMQIQRGDQFPMSTIRKLREVVPPECLLISWNGDVRTGGTASMEAWQAEVGRLVDLYLVSNNTQPGMLASEGVRAGYLPVGYDPHLSDYRRDAGPQEGEGGVVFAGQMYCRLDHGFRRRLFEAVAQRFPGHLTLFGGLWDHSPILKPCCGGQRDQEAMSYVYSRARVSVATSLFTDLRRYTSDRLKRMLGSGAVTALHALDDYEGLGIRDGVHALIWRDQQDLLGLLVDWLRPERDGARRALREAAHALALESMTWDVIVENLLAIVRAERHRRATC